MRVFLLLFGRFACVFFAVWAGGVFFLAVWAADYSLAGLPGSSLRDPTTKKTKQQKTKTWVPHSLQEVP